MLSQFKRPIFSGTRLRPIARPNRAGTHRLIRDGFVLDRQSGSHRLYLHPDGRRVTISYHASGETFRRKTLKALLELQANWDTNDLKR